jgi:hypothetical protein
MKRRAIYIGAPSNGLNYGMTGYYVGNGLFSPDDQSFGTFNVDVKDMYFPEY